MWGTRSEAAPAGPAVHTAAALRMVAADAAALGRRSDVAVAGPAQAAAAAAADCGCECDFVPASCRCVQQAPFESYTALAEAVGALRHLESLVACQTCGHGLRNCGGRDGDNRAEKSPLPERVA